MADDREDNRRASERVADALSARIEKGEFRTGDALPTYRQLAKEYDVAINTAHAGVRLLQAAGWVTIRPNAAARVRDREAAIDPVAELRSIRSDLDDLRDNHERDLATISTIRQRLDTVVNHLAHPQ
uniref:winged helix-turn-helix domain-containing protein n=1 Tax=Nocardia suismassiliense TaxID=2077092 RepID=UPI003F49176D